MLFRLFDKLMTALGRKFAFLDMYGDVRFYRYYVFYVELNDDESWVARWLPNLFVHHFPGEPGEEGPDGDQPHFHPWSTLSLILTGGYTHTVNGVERVHVAPSKSFMRHSDQHIITRMKPGTVTLFFHWLRKQRWLVDARTCVKVCDSCQRLNDGQCMRSNRIRPMNPVTELAMSSRDAKGWRAAKWVRVDSGFEELRAERRRAIAKAGKTIPIRSSDKFTLLKEQEIVKRRRAKNV